MKAVKLELKSQAVVVGVHAFNTSTWKTEASGYKATQGNPGKTKIKKKEEELKISNHTQELQKYNSPKKSKNTPMYLFIQRYM